MGAGAEPEVEEGRESDGEVMQLLADVRVCMDDGEDSDEGSGGELGLGEWMDGDGDADAMDDGTVE